MTAAFPTDSEPQRLGRMAELMVVRSFESHGWTVPGPSTKIDFGVDFSAYSRTSAGQVLPLSVAVQVKGLGRTFDPGPVRVRAKSSSVSLWLWSQTPTILVVADATGALKWETVPGALPRRPPSAIAKARTLTIGRSLDSARDWQELEELVRRQWAAPLGVGVLGDLPLALHVLTELAFDTELWSALSDVQAVHEAAATFVFRVASGLNALVGKVGHPKFLQLADAELLCEGFGVATVSRGGEQLGLVEFVSAYAWPEDLLNVFRRCAQEIMETLPRLCEVSRAREFGVPEYLQQFLEQVLAQARLSALVDPKRTADLTSGDFKQISHIDDDVHLGRVNMPQSPDLVNRAPRHRRFLIALDAEGVLP